MLTKFKMTFPGTPVDLWHGDEEKQGAHMKRESGACMRKQKERSRNARGCESDRARPTSYKPDELFHDSNLNTIIHYTCCNQMLFGSLEQFLKYRPTEFYLRHRAIDVNM